MVRVRHHRPAARRARACLHRIPMARSRDLVDWDVRRRRLPAAQPARLGRRRRRRCGRRTSATSPAATSCTTWSPRPPSPGPNDNADRGRHRADPDRPVDRLRRAGGRAAPGDSGNPDDFLWTFDPAHLVAADGRQYLYYGSYYGGVFAIRADRGRHPAVGEPDHGRDRQPLRGRVRRAAAAGWYYLFASSSNCCAGPITGYSVFVGRSRQPARAVRRPRRRPAADLAGRRHHRGHPERQPLGRHRPQRGRHRPVRPGLARLPRDRPARRRTWTSRSASTAADAARPAGLDRRLADRAGRPLGLRRPAAGPGRRAGRTPSRPGLELDGAPVRGWTVAGRPDGRFARPTSPGRRRELRLARARRRRAGPGSAEHAPWSAARPRGSGPGHRRASAGGRSLGRRQRPDRRVRCRAAAHTSRRAARLGADRRGAPTCCGSSRPGGRARAGPCRAGAGRAGAVGAARRLRPGRCRRRDARPASTDRSATRCRRPGSARWSATRTSSTRAARSGVDLGRGRDAGRHRRGWPAGLADPGRRPDRRPATTPRCCCGTRRPAPTRSRPR